MRSIMIAGLVAIAGVVPASAATVIGNIEVYNSGNAFLGYISKVFESQHCYTFTSNFANALIVGIDTAEAGPVSILATNSPSAGNAYLGAVGGSGGFNFAANTLAYAYLAGTSLFAAGSTPSTPGTTSLQVSGNKSPASPQFGPLPATFSLLSGLIATIVRIRP